MSFRSINESIGWFGVAASSLCAFASSPLQQHLVNTSVHDFIVQINFLKALKRKKYLMTFEIQTDNKKYDISVLACSDAGGVVAKVYGRLGFIVGVLIGKLQHGSIFHLLH